jgi:hypothetical protein
MDPERLDLSPLDPAADAERWARLAAAIARRAAPELARRAQLKSPLLFLAGWARPMLSAAAALAAISVATLATADHTPRRVATPPRGLVEVLQVPAPAAAWLLEERAPTVDDLILALDGETR